MKKKENIKEYLQKMLDRWNKYDELDGFVAENFRTDLEKTLEYWDLRIADNKQELEKAREEGRREGDIASDFLYWHPLGGGMPDSSIRIGVEFEVGGCYEDWGFVIEENGKPISSGRTLKEAIDKLKTKEDGK